jgi:hypothetical protein
MLDVLPTAAHLTLNTSVGLRDGFYDGFRIVDSDGRRFRVRSATKIARVGGSWLSSLFMNQRIRVHLDIEDEHTHASVDEVRGMVLNEFDTWKGWESRGDYFELRRDIESARTTRELLERLAAAVT